MRINRGVLLLSLLLGVAGGWAIVNATTTYVDTTRAYTSVDVLYERGTFVWLENDYSRAVADVTIENRSDTEVRVTFLALHLHFDGAFVGSRYTPWEPLNIRSGESRTVTTEFSVATAGIGDRGGEGALSLGGNIALEFAGVNEPLTFPLSGTIGQVSEVRE